MCPEHLEAEPWRWTLFGGGYAHTAHDAEAISLHGSIDSSKEEYEGELDPAGHSTSAMAGSSSQQQSGSRFFVCLCQ